MPDEAQNEELGSQEAAAAEAEAAKKLEAEKAAKAEKKLADAKAKAKKEGKDIYKCVYAVRHNGSLYENDVTLTPEEAAPLLKAGAISK